LFTVKLILALFFVSGYLEADHEKAKHSEMTRLGAAWKSSAGTLDRCSLALAAGTGGGGGLPWETPLQNVQQSLTGPVAKGVALIAIVGALGTLLFLHAEMNQFTRVIVFVVMGIGTLVGANAFLSGSGAQGAEITSASKARSYAPQPAQYSDPSRR
jgi:type IV secretion system protein VirB2